MPRKLPHLLIAYRIGDPAGRYPIYSGEGAATVAVRWHEKGQDVIYASVCYSTAMLEKLAHFRGILPRNQHFLKIEIPAGLTYEVVTRDTVPSWNLAESREARAFGASWFGSRRSAVLPVPSYVAREEQNVLINPHHSDARLIVPGLETPVWWDEQLFAAVPRTKK